MSVCLETPESELSAAPVDATSTDTLRESLAGSFLLMLVMMVVQRALGLGREVLFCRWLSPDALGEWELALAFLTLAAPLTVLGIPGSFGRYVEHFRHKGQLGGFLRQSLLVVTLLSLVALVVMLVMPTLIAEQVFGRADQLALVLPLGLSLLAVIGFNFAGDMYSGLRSFRAVSLMQFIQAAAFAGLGVALAWWWEPSARSIIVSYGGACLLALLAAIWMWRGSSVSAASETKLAARAIVQRVAPFAAWLWTTNLLLNLFLIVDRYLLLHHSALPYDEALVLLGNYRASRVVPLLLATVATTLTGVALPHLSHDWEAGRRDVVARRTRLMLKLYALVGVATAAGVMLVKPWLFDVAFRGKFAGGEAVLPGTFMYCVWIGMGLIAHYYLLCAERASRGSLVVAVGLVANIGLNLWLAPRMGLVGVVTATALANLLVLVLTCLVAQRHGLSLDLGMWVAMALPATLLAGVWPAIAALVIVAALALCTQAVFDTEERRELSSFLAGVLSRARQKAEGRRQVAQGTSTERTP